jgi:iron(III) transport system permease protein
MSASLSGTDARPLNVQTLSTYIYQFATRGNFEEGALAALVIIAVSAMTF